MYGRQVVDEYGCPLPPHLLVHQNRFRILNTQSQICQSVNFSRHNENHGQVFNPNMVRCRRFLCQSQEFYVALPSPRQSTISNHPSAFRTTAQRRMVNQRSEACLYGNQYHVAMGNQGLNMNRDSITNRFNDDVSGRMYAGNEANSDMHQRGTELEHVTGRPNNELCDLQRNGIHTVGFESLPTEKQNKESCQLKGLPISEFEQLSFQFVNDNSCRSVFADKNNNFYQHVLAKRIETAAVERMLGEGPKLSPNTSESEPTHSGQDLPPTRKRLEISKNNMDSMAVTIAQPVNIARKEQGTATNEEVHVRQDHSYSHQQAADITPVFYTNCQGSVGSPQQGKKQCNLNYTTLRSKENNAVKKTKPHNIEQSVKDVRKEVKSKLVQNSNLLQNALRGIIENEDKDKENSISTGLKSPVLSTVTSAGEIGGENSISTGLKSPVLSTVTSGGEIGGENRVRAGRKVPLLPTPTVNIAGKQTKQNRSKVGQKGPLLPIPTDTSGEKPKLVCAGQVVAPNGTISYIQNNVTMCNTESSVPHNDVLSTNPPCTLRYLLTYKAPCSQGGRGTADCSTKGFDVPGTEGISTETSSPNSHCRASISNTLMITENPHTTSTQPSNTYMFSTDQFYFNTTNDGLNNPVRSTRSCSLKDRQTPNIGAISESQNTVKSKPPVLPCRVQSPKPQCLLTDKSACSQGGSKIAKYSAKGLDVPGTKDTSSSNTPCKSYTARALAEHDQNIPVARMQTVENHSLTKDDSIHSNTNTVLCTVDPCMSATQASNAYTFSNDQFYSSTTHLGLNDPVCSTRSCSLKDKQEKNKKLADRRKNSRDRRATSARKKNARGVVKDQSNNKQEGNEIPDNSKKVPTQSTVVTSTELKSIEGQRVEDDRGGNLQQNNEHSSNHSSTCCNVLVKNGKNNQQSSYSSIGMATQTSLSGTGSSDNKPGLTLPNKSHPGVISSENKPCSSGTVPHTSHSGIMSSGNQSVSSGTVLYTSHSGAVPHKYTECESQDLHNKNKKKSSQEFLNTLCQVLSLVFSSKENQSFGKKSNNHNSSTSNKSSSQQSKHFTDHGTKNVADIDGIDNANSPSVRKDNDSVKTRENISRVPGACDRNIFQCVFDSAAESLSSEKSCNNIKVIPMYQDFEIIAKESDKMCTVDKESNEANLAEMVTSINCDYRTSDLTNNRKDVSMNPSKVKNSTCSTNVGIEVSQNDIDRFSTTSLDDTLPYQHDDIESVESADLSANDQTKLDVDLTSMEADEIYSSDKFAVQNQSVNHAVHSANCGQNQSQSSHPRIDQCPCSPDHSVESRCTGNPCLSQNNVPPSSCADTNKDVFNENDISCSLREDSEKILEKHLQIDHNELGEQDNNQAMRERCSTPDLNKPPTKNLDQSFSFLELGYCPIALPLGCYDYDGDADENNNSPNKSLPSNDHADTLLKNKHMVKLCDEKYDKDKSEILRPWIIIRLDEIPKPTVRKEFMREMDKERGIDQSSSMVGDCTYEPLDGNQSPIDIPLDEVKDFGVLTDERVDDYCSTLLKDTCPNSENLYFEESIKLSENVAACGDHNKLENICKADINKSSPELYVLADSNQTRSEFQLQADNNQPSSELQVLADNNITNSERTDIDSSKNGKEIKDHHTSPSASKTNDKMCFTKGDNSKNTTDNTVINSSGEHCSEVNIEEKTMDLENKGLVEEVVNVPISPVQYQRKMNDNTLVKSSKSSNTVRKKYSSTENTLMQEAMNFLCNVKVSSKGLGYIYSDVSIQTRQKSMEMRKRRNTGTRGKRSKTREDNPYLHSGLVDNLNNSMKVQMPGRKSKNDDGQKPSDESEYVNVSRKKGRKRGGRGAKVSSEPRSKISPDPLSNEDLSDVVQENISYKLNISKSRDEDNSEITEEKTASLGNAPTGKDVETVPETTVSNTKSLDFEITMSETFGLASEEAKLPQRILDISPGKSDAVLGLLSLRNGCTSKDAVPNNNIETQVVNHNEEANPKEAMASHSTDNKASLGSHFSDTIESVPLVIATSMTPKSSVNTTSMTPKSSLNTRSMAPKSSLNTSMTPKSSDNTTSMALKSSDNTTSLASMNSDNTTSLASMNSDNTTSMTPKSSDNTTNMASKSSDNTTNLASNSSDNTTSMASTCSDNTSMASKSTDNSTSITPKGSDNTSNMANNTTSLASTSSDNTTSLASTSTDNSTSLASTSSDNTTNMTSKSTDNTTNMATKSLDNTTGMASTSSDNTTSISSKSSDNTTNMASKSSDNTTNMTSKSTDNTANMASKSSDNTACIALKISDNVTSMASESLDKQTNMVSESSDNRTSKASQNSDRTASIASQSSDDTTNNVSQSIEIQGSNTTTTKASQKTDHTVSQASHSCEITLGTSLHSSDNTASTSTHSIDNSDTDTAEENMNKSKLENLIDDRISKLLNRVREQISQHMNLPVVHKNKKLSLISAAIFDSDKSVATSTKGTSGTQTCDRSQSSEREIRDKDEDSSTLDGYDSDTIPIVEKPVTPEKPAGKWLVPILERLNIDITQGRVIVTQSAKKVTVRKHCVRTSFSCTSTPVTRKGRKRKCESPPQSEKPVKKQPSHGKGKSKRPKAEKSEEEENYQPRKTRNRTAKEIKETISPKERKKRSPKSKQISPKQRGKQAKVKDNNIELEADDCEEESMKVIENNDRHDSLLQDMNEPELNQRKHSKRKLKFGTRKAEHKLKKLKKAEKVEQTECANNTAENSQKSLPSVDDRNTDVASRKRKYTRNQSKKLSKKSVLKSLKTLRTTLPPNAKSELKTLANGDKVKVRCITDPQEQKILRLRSKALKALQKQYINKNCPFCKTVVCASQLMYHVRAKHPFRCSKCGLVFTSKEEKSRHGREKHTETHYHCILCNKSFDMKFHYMFHVRSSQHRMFRDIYRRAVNIMKTCLRLNIGSAAEQDFPMLEDTTAQGTNQVALPTQQQPYLFCSSEDVAFSKHEPEVQNLLNDLADVKSHMLNMFSSSFSFPHGDCQIAGGVTTQNIITDLTYYTSESAHVEEFSGSNFSSISSNPDISPIMGNSPNIEESLSSPSTILSSGNTNSFDGFHDMNAGNQVGKCIADNGMKTSKPMERSPNGLFLDAYKILENDGYFDSSFRGIPLEENPIPNVCQVPHMEGVSMQQNSVNITQNPFIENVSMHQNPVYPAYYEPPIVEIPRQQNAILPVCQGDYLGDIRHEPRSDMFMNNTIVSSESYTLMDLSSAPPPMMAERSQTSGATYSVQENRPISMPVLSPENSFPVNEERIQIEAEYNAISQDIAQSVDLDY